MKKISAIVLSALSLGIASQANAAIAPSDTPAATTIDNTACAMVSVNSSFQFTASRNVGVGFACDVGGTIVAVNAGNIKGKYVYGGSSNGGSVKQCGTTAVSATNGYSVAAPAVTATSDGCS
jgi:hypothetical protein